MEYGLIGKRIRALREQRKMSIQDLAASIPGRPEDNAALIQSLESGSNIPSLTPLLQIARALGVRLGSFLDDHDNTGPALVKAGSSEKSARFVGSNLDVGGRAELNFHALAANKLDRHMEPMLIDVMPHAGNAVLSSHEGEEFIYVLAGKISIAYGTTEYKLSAGDSIYYDSVVPHHLHSDGNEQAKILAVIYAPM